MTITLLLAALFAGAELSIEREASLSNDTLIIDSTCSQDEFSWRRYALDASNVRFKRGSSYEISFKTKVTAGAEQSKLLVLVRPEPDMSSGRLDAGSIKIGPTDGQWREAKIRVDSLERDDYRLQFHSWNKIRAEIADVKVRERAPATFIPATRDDASVPTDETSVPRGATEFDVTLPEPAADKMINAADYGMNPSNLDNTIQLRRALEDAKARKANGLKIPRGVYRFHGDSPVILSDLKDFTFDGDGSTFISLRKQGAFLYATNCERIQLRNFSLDWDWDLDPLASLVEIERVDSDSYDLRFRHYEDFPRKDTMLMLLSAYDPITESVGFEGGITRSIDFARKGAEPTKREWLSGNRLRVSRNPDGLKVGQLYRLQHYYYHLNAFVFDSNAFMRLERVNVLSTPGHAFVIKGTQHHTVFDRVNITVPEKNPRRVITCTADHLHVVNSCGFLKLVNCEFSRGADDCVNLHDCSGFARKCGDHAIRTDNARVYGSLPVGTKIELRNSDYSPSGFIGTLVKSVAIDAAKGLHELSFKESVPDDHGDGFVMFNRTYDTRNIIIRNCYFHDNRARGLLILARDVTVENCTFRHHEQGAIKIETGYTLNAWSEGYGVSNVVFRGNVFDNVNPSCSNHLHGRRSVYLGVYMRSDPSSDVTTYPILNDILFENNEFRNDSGVVAWISSAANVTFRNNRIDERIIRKSPTSDRGRFFITNANGVRFENNTWTDISTAPAPGIVFDTESCKNIKSFGNAIR